LWQIAPTSFVLLTEQLEVYVRQAAWLNTVPEKAKLPRFKTSAAVMPPLKGGGYLAEILFDIGPAVPAGMGGLVAIRDVDLAAWQANRDLRLSAWECRTIRRLSQAYASEASSASDPNAIAPYVAPKELIPREQREKISKAMDDWADKLNRAKPRP
jgi:hypothetical protein